MMMKMRKRKVKMKWKMCKNLKVHLIHYQGQVNKKSRQKNYLKMMIERCINEKSKIKNFTELFLKSFY